MIIDNYSNFLKKFINKNYRTVFFDEYNLSGSNQLILRHDIDQDCEIAYKLSCIENQLNIKSTYFFLLRNNSYNLISEENVNFVNKIKDNGHLISLHFDPTLYKNVNKGLKKEIDVFENIFNEKVKIISLHRPLKNMLGSENMKVLDFPNTYEDIFFKKTKYFSDSRGEFRYGSPFDSFEYKQGYNIQLLVHPIWWIGEGITVEERINWFRKHKNNNLENSLKNNFDFYGK